MRSACRFTIISASNAQTVTEVRHGFKDVHAAACPECGGAMALVFHPAGVVFKGSGSSISPIRAKAAEARAARAKSWRPLRRLPREPKTAEAKPADAKKSHAACSE